MINTKKQMKAVNQFSYLTFLLSNNYVAYTKKWLF